MAISVQSAHGHAGARPLRHRRPTRSLARAGDHRREDRGHRDHRARRRLRRRRDPDPRRPRRRRLAHQRPQDVHHQRGARALPHARREDRSRRRAPRHLAVHRRHVAAGRVGVAPAREARHALVRHRGDRARRRAGPPRRPRRARARPGLRATDVAAAVRTPRRRRRVGRSRDAGARRHDRVRPRAQDVRAADRASTR